MAEPATAGAISLHGGQRTRGQLCRVSVFIHGLFMSMDHVNYSLVIITQSQQSVTSPTRRSLQLIDVAHSLATGRVLHRGKERTSSSVRAGATTRDLCFVASRPVGASFNSGRTMLLRPLARWAAEATYSVAGGVRRGRPGDAAVFAVRVQRAWWYVRGLCMTFKQAWPAGSVAELLV